MEIGLDEKYALATYLHLDKEKLYIAEYLIKIRDTQTLNCEEWNSLILYIRESK